MALRRPHIRFSWVQLRRELVLLLLSLLVAGPLVTQFSDSVVEAATTLTGTLAILKPLSDGACYTEAQNYFDPTVKTTPVAAARPATDQGDDTTHINDESPFSVQIDLTTIKNDATIPQSIRDTLTSSDRLKSILLYYNEIGVTYYKDSTGEEYMLSCKDEAVSIDTRFFDPEVPLDPDGVDLLSLLADPTPKITFANPMDYQAVVGETCPGGLVGTPAQWAKGANPCPSFTAANDTFIADGKWDAPRVDPRVAQTLAYLVAPASQGGAAREHIRVKQITSKCSSGYTAIVSSPSTDGTTSTTSQLDCTQYQIDPNDSATNPTKVASALDIDEIDNVRVSTKTVQQRLFGNNTTTYQYTAPFPVKVAWQSTSGQASNPPPNFSNMSLLASSRFLANQAIIELLNQQGLGDLELDPSSMDINNFGDVATLVGKSMLEQVLGTPSGSLKGWDLSSTLQSIGRAYLTQQLGLLPGSLSQGDDFDSIVQNIGRTTVEYAMKLPSGSLQTADGTSQEVISQLGERYLESQIFKVSAGSLFPAPQNVGDLLARLGAGRVEQVFKLPAGSLQPESYSKIPNRTNAYDQLRNSSYKATLIFPPGLSDARQPSADDYGMSDYISTQLGLTFVKYGNSSTSMYGFGPGDFDKPLIQLEKNPTDSQLNQFMQLVGSRVIEGSVGTFSAAGLDSKQIVPIENIVTESRTAPRYEHSTPGRPINLPPPFTAPQPILDIIQNAQRAPLNPTAANFGDPATDPFNTIPGTDGSGRNTDVCSAERTIIAPGGTIGCSSYGSADSQLNAVNLSLSVTQNLTATTPTTDRVYTGPALDLTQFTDPKYKNSDGTWSDAGNIALNQWDLLSYSNPANYSTSTAETILTELGSMDDLNGPDKTELIRRINELAGKTATVSSQINTLEGQLQTSKPAQLDASILTILNEITAKPAVGDSFKDQYASGGFDGISFLIQDINQRYGCLISKGTYAYSDDVAGYACTSTPTDASLQDKRINGVITQATTLAKALTDALDRGSADDVSGGITYSGQSGFSVAVGLPGQNVIADANGIFAMSTDQSLSHDPMRALLAPQSNADGTVPRDAAIPQAAGILQSIGKLAAAKSFSTDPVTQKSVTSLLNPNVPDITQAEKDLANMGVTDGLFQQNGMGPDDFSLIFQLDSSDMVFERIGKQALGAAVWNSSGIGANLAGSTGYQNLLSTLHQLSQEYSFYTTRLDSLNLSATKLNADLGSLSTQLKAAGATLQQAGSALDVLSSKLGTTIQSASTAQSKQVGQNIKALQTAAKDYQPIFSRLTQLYNQIEKGHASKTDSLGKAVISVENDTQAIIHTLEEMMAGQALPQHTSLTAGADPNASLSQPPKATGSQCVKPTELIASVIKNKKAPDTTINVGGHKIKNNLSDYGFYIGSCQLEISLGLPTGTLVNWFILGQSAYPATPASATPAATATAAAALAKTCPTPLDTYLSPLVTTDPLTGLIGPAPDFNASACPSDYVPLTPIIAPGAAANCPSQLDSFLSPVVVTDPLTGLLVPASASDCYVAPTSAPSPSPSPSPGSTVTPTDAPTDTSPITGVPTWSKNQWTLEALYIATGYADAESKGKAPGSSIEDINTFSADTVMGLEAQGKKILELTALNKLLSLIPGYGAFVKANQITGQDLTDLLNGKPQAILAKVGGLQLDQALNLPAGTGRQLISPTCHDATTGKVAPCDGSSPSQDASNVRSEIMAQIGLKRIGLAIPNFPTNFDLLGSGNFAERWGNARLTGALGLAPNSLEGNIDDPTSTVYSQNLNPLYNDDVRPLMHAFGVYSGAEASLTALRNALMSVYNGNAPPESVIPFVSGLDNPLTAFLKQSTLNTLSKNAATDNTYGYWAGFMDNPPGQARTNAQQGGLLDLTESDWNAIYGSSGLLQTWWTEVGSQDYLSGNDTIDQARTRAARKAILAAFYPKAASDNAVLDAANPPAGPSSDEFYNTFLSSYQFAVSFFQNRLDTIDLQNGIDKPKMRDFLVGNISAEALDIQSGKSNIVSAEIAKFDDYLNNDAPVWLQNLNKGFSTLYPEQCAVGNGNVTPAPKSSGGRDQSDGLGWLIQNMIAGNKSCGINAVDFKLSDILTASDPAHKAFRAFLFDTYLSKGVLGHVDSTLKWQQGTMRSIIIDPSNTQQILVTQGVLMMANRIFGTADPNDPNRIKADTQSGCIECAVRGNLKKAFLAGFYDVDRKQYTLTFNTTRASQAFMDSFMKEVKTMIQAYSQKRLGVSLTISDVNGLLNGNMQVFDYIGLQLLVNQANAQLTKSMQGLGGTGSNGFKSNAAQFFITYDEVRAAAGLTTLTAAQQTAAAQAGIDQMEKDAVKLAYSDNTDGLNQNIASGESYDEMYTDLFLLEYKNTNALQEVADNKAAAAKQGVISAQQALPKNAQTALEYKTYDIIAFSLDHNIPPDFSRRMFSDSDQEKASAVKDYLYNTVLANDKTLRDSLNKIGVTTAVGAEKLGDALWAAVAKQGVQRTAAFNTLLNLNNGNGLVIDKADQAFQAWFAGKLHVNLSDVPSGLLKGLFVWGAHGFDPKQFDHQYGILDKNGKPAGTLLSIGRVMENFGRTLVYNWADKELGFKPGTTQQIVTIAKDLKVLSQATATGQQVAMFDLTASALKAANSLQAATTALNTANAAVTAAQQTLTVALATGDNTVIALARGNLAATTSQQLGAAGALATANTAKAAVTAAQDAAQKLADAQKAFDSAKKGSDLTQVTKNLNDAKKASDAANKAASKYLTASAQGAAKLAAEQALGQEVKQLILQVFNSQLLALDSAFGLPPGTMSQVAAIGLEYLGHAFLPNIFPVDPVTIGLAVAFLVYSLITGVVKTVVTVRGTADGDYPFYNHGTGGASAPPYSEHYGTDSSIGEFDPANGASYHQGLLNSARTKVTGLIRDLLEMPTSQWAKLHHIKPESLWIPQIFTWSDPTFDPTQDDTNLSLINRNAPWDKPADLGYGKISDRFNITLDPNTLQYTGTASDNVRSGVWNVLQTPDFVHIRF